MLATREAWFLSPCSEFWDRRGKIHSRSTQLDQRVASTQCTLSTWLPLLVLKPLPRNGSIPPPAKLVRRGGSWQGQGPAWRLSAICFFMASGWKASVWRLLGSWEFGENGPPPRPRRQTSNYRGAVCVLGDSHPSYPQRQQKEGRVGSAMNEEACPTPSHEHHQDECLFWKDGGHTQITWKG